MRDQSASGLSDLVVVDCAPTAETLRLLTLPEVLGWYMDRVLPLEHRLVKVLKPVLTRATGVAMPQDSVFDAIQRRSDRLACVPPGVTLGSQLVTIADLSRPDIGWF